MKKLIIYLLLLIYYLPVFSQINKIIPFEFGNPNALDITFHDSKYIIPVIYPGDTSTIIEFQPGAIRYSHLENFDFSSSPIGVIDDKYYFFGKDRSKSKGLKVSKSSNDFVCVNYPEIQTESSFNFPLSSIEFQDQYLVSYLFGERGDLGYNGLALLDTNLNILWQKDYNLDVEATYSFDIEESMDENILISYDYRLESKFGTYAGLTKIDPFGEVIWDTRWDERTAAGSHIYHTQLTNSNVVLSYEVDRWNDPIFIGNGWYHRPTRLLWLDGKGKFVQEKYIIGPRKQKIVLANVDFGRGNYFFAYGKILGEDDVEGGLITKYSNKGDTIWSRKYQHPDFRGVDPGYWISDIIEHEDGTIAVLAQVFPIGERSRIWLFELNEYGCYGDDMNCSNYVIVGDPRDTIDLMSPSNENIVILPNPAQDVVYVKTIVPIENATVSIYSTEGKLESCFILSDDKSIDIKNLPKGVHFIHIKSYEINITEKLIKL